MPILNLDKLFYPRSVAVIGASNREGAAGQVVMQNLLHGGFEGPIMPVTSDERAIAGVLAYPKVEDLPITPDLAVVCAPASTAMPELRALGVRGTRAAILLAQEPKDRRRNGGVAEAVAVRAEAQRFGLRLLGPDCLGVMVPGIGLNASVAHTPARPGGVAFVSQSTTVCAGVLDWACERDIGFSHFISLGATADICFGDILDYLGNDAMTRAVLLYVESIKNGRSFLSAGRGASRNKPILVIKAGRTAEGQMAAFGQHSADCVDDVYDAAIRRAGMLRVYGFNELFAAVETLARTRPLRGERLAILSNGRGMAVMAVDALILDGGNLARLSEQTLASLNAIAPGGVRLNPVEFDEHAPPEHYGAAVRVLLQDPGVDAVMVLHAPASGVSSTRAAEAVIQAHKEARGSVLTSWMGGARVAEARHLFANARIPTYDTPNQAIDAFLHMMRFRRNQEILIETPNSMPAEFTPATEPARLMVDGFLAQGRNFLFGREAKALLAAYGVPTEARSAHSHAPGQAPAIASPAIQVVRDGHNGRAAPAGRMIGQPAAHEVMIRVFDDPVFGPVISFGHGGIAADVIGDRAVALPPLNTSLARDLLSRTRIFRLLQGYGDRLPADIDALCLTLVQVSQMIVDLPQIAALEINPLLVDEHGVCAADAQMLIAHPSEATERRLAIRPYPKELEEEFTLPNGRRVMLRPIRPEDEPEHHDFISHCSPEDLRLRFFHLVRRLPHAEMARLTQIDYDREMAIVASAPRQGGGSETLGVVRVISDLHNDKAEYAILVRSDVKGQRLGRKLMEKIIDYCRSRGTRRVVGLVLADNRKMLDLVRRLGFTCRRIPDDDVMEVELLLEPAAAAPAAGPEAASAVARDATAAAG